MGGRTIYASIISRFRRLPKGRQALSALAVVAGRLLLRAKPNAGASFVSDEAPLIIVGMHRSGTSLVARLLVHAGLYLGGSWVDENQEAYHFIRANRAMLGEGTVRLHDYGWTAPKTDGFIQARRGYAEQCARDMSPFFAEREDGQAWGWKDPRNCLTLPVWLSIYPAARVLHVLRDGRAVALSLTDRDQLDPAFGLALWGVHVERAERALDAVPAERKHLVHYEDLLESPEPVTRAILECALPGRDADVSSLMANVDRSRADAWRDDPRVAAIASDPLLARYGYDPV